MPSARLCASAGLGEHQAAITRNFVERFFNKLKHSRAIATRFEKHDANYLALVKLAATRIWLRFMSR